MAHEEVHDEGQEYKKLADVAGIRLMSRNNVNLVCQYSRGVNQIRRFNTFWII
jgi:hypothetical protein